MSNQNILLIGGTHGNEFTGIKLVKYLLKNPIPNIQPILANQEAIKRKVRFVETDLNRSSDIPKPKTYEEKLIKTLKPKIMGADFVIEFHNTTAKNNTCAIVTTKPNSLHYSLADHFGIKKVLIMPPKGSLSGLRPDKFFSLEISLDDPLLTNIKYLVSKLTGISSRRQKRSKQIKVYQYANLSVTQNTPKQVGITLSQLENFQKFSSREVRLLSLPKNKKFCPVFIGEKAYGKSFGFHVARIV